MQNNVVDSNVNLSVCAPEVGMLQPEALSQASLLTVTPLLLSTGNHANSGGNSMHKCTQRKNSGKCCILGVVALSGCRVWRCLIRHISLSLSFSSSIYLSGCSAEAA